MTSPSIPLSSDSQQVECVEIYIPKTLEHLSALSSYLREKLRERQAGQAQPIPIDGFSLYEVDGAFFSERVYQERTLVVRILFTRAPADDDAALARKIAALGSEIAGQVARSELELWICHSRQNVHIVRPGERSSSQS